MDYTGVGPRVQFVAASAAVAGSEAVTVPAFDELACRGCTLQAACRGVGGGVRVQVEEVRSVEHHCRLIDAVVRPCVVAPPVKRELVRRGSRPALKRVVMDASVFINARRWKWQQCIEVLGLVGKRIEVVVPRAVFEELKFGYELPEGVRVVDVDGVDPRLVEAAAANVTHLGKGASLQDLSLLQLAANDARVCAIISEDDDVHRLHSRSLLPVLGGAAVPSFTCQEFVAEHAAWFK